MINKKISIVVPCYNEEGNILNMHTRLKSVLYNITELYEIIFVNNGSTDDSDNIFNKLVLDDNNVIVINLSRNFGNSQPAYTCGMEYATGDCVICLDGDIQDPPELIPSMVEKWLLGYHVIYGIRKKRKGSIFKRICYKIFYRIFKKLSYIDIPLDAGDFSLIDRKVVDCINMFPERNRFLRGIRAWAGFRQIGVEYERADRESGSTSNSFFDNIRWAKMGIFSFSFVPLEYISYIAIIVVIIAFLGVIIYGILALVFPDSPRGFPTTILAILFLGGIQLLCLSVIGEYMAKIFEEVKQRPKFLIKDILKKDTTNNI